MREMDGEKAESGKGPKETVGERRGNRERERGTRAKSRGATPQWRKVSRKKKERQGKRDVA